jgi:hypothetical protein
MLKAQVGAVTGREPRTLLKTIRALTRPRGSNPTPSASCLTSDGLSCGWPRVPYPLLKVDGTTGGLACPAGVAPSRPQATTASRRKLSR